jgi:hypothetical protein
MPHAVPLLLRAPRLLCTRVFCLPCRSTQPCWLVPYTVSAAASCPCPVPYSAFASASARISAACAKFTLSLYNRSACNPC